MDDLYDFGRVAAANAFSDVYSMGGKPIFALNIVCFPVAALGTDALGRLLEGGNAIAAEAGVPVLGGHSIRGETPIYGMVVTGTVHPDRIMKNTGARDGDALFLTKPLGSGILTTAIKKGALDDDDQKRVVDVMASLNTPSAEAMQEVGARAATDVTGFGLLGHGREMLHGGDIGLEIDYAALPFMDRVHEVLESGICPGGTKKNLAYFGEWTDFDDGVTEDQRLALADAQTSGGVLIAVAEEKADELAAALREKGALAAARVGRFTADHPGRIRVRP